MGFLYHQVCRNSKARTFQFEVGSIVIVRTLESSEKEGWQEPPMCQRSSVGDVRSLDLVPPHRYLSLVTGKLD
jgi:hypothetical protein